MSESEEFVAFLTDVSFHIIEIGRHLIRYMMRRTMGDTLIEHRNGHVPDPSYCPYCKYDREVVEPRDAARARDAFRARHLPRSSIFGRDEVDATTIVDTDETHNVPTIADTDKYF